MLVAGCSAWSVMQDPPHVTLRKLELVEMTLFEQRYRLELRITNTADQALAVRGMTFTVHLNGKKFAQGVGNQAFTVPPLGDEIVQVEVGSSLFDVLHQIQQLGDKAPEAFRYRLEGTVRLQDGIGRLSFDEEGEIALPTGSPSGLGGV